MLPRLQLSALFFRAKFLPQCLERFQSGLEDGKSQILLQSLLFVTLLQVNVDATVQSIVVEPGQLRNTVAKRAKRKSLVEHIDNWGKNEIPIP